MSLDRFDRFSELCVAVIGDLMIDVYLHGDVSRISPEAPVPVVHWRSEKSTPGGSANVAANVASLGAKAVLVGLAGQDEGVAQLARMLKDFGDVDLDGVVRDPSRGTIQKIRVLGQRQQMVRIDREDKHPLDADIEAEIVARAIEAVAKSDIVVLSDYGKGVLSDRVVRAAISHARAAGKPVIVDPKRRDLSAYNGASIITPNRAELALATGLQCETDEEATEAAHRTQRTCDADILLTRSERGMSYFARGAEPLHFPTVAREVFDVSGAGDTVVAVLATALAAQFPIVEAIKAANHAAGIVVGRLGTSSLTRAELASSFSTTLIDDKPDGRLLDLAQAVLLRQAWKSQGFTVGLTNGCFDLLHPGHVALIRQAAATCDRLIVALNTDASVRRLKGSTRPVQKEWARAEVMGAVKGVAAVILFEDDTPYEIIKALLPDVLIKGADYTEAQVVGADIVRANGGEVLLAKLIEGQSTSKLIATTH